MARARPVSGHSMFPQPAQRAAPENMRTDYNSPLPGIQTIAVEYEDDAAQNVALVRLNKDSSTTHLPMVRLNKRRWIRVLFLAPPGWDYYLEIDGNRSPAKLFQCRFTRPVRGLLVLRHRRCGAELSLVSAFAPLSRTRHTRRTQPKQVARS